MGYIPPQWGSVSDWMRIVASNVNPLLASNGKTYAESLQGITTGAGVSDPQQDQNTAAINAELAKGTRLYFRSRIEIGSSLFFTNGSGLIGESSDAAIYMPGNRFSNTNNSTVDGAWGANTRYGSNAVGLNFSGQISSPYTPVTNVLLKDFKVESDPSMGRYLRAIVGLNVQDCQIINVEVTGIPTGIGICMASAIGCKIERPRIHDFNDTTSVLTSPQSTAIEFDNDIANGVASSRSRIDLFYIYNIWGSGNLLSASGLQTDGINICKNGSQVAIGNGYIGKVGEGIDTFGCGGISNVVIEDCYNYGLKFIHGASRNACSAIVINRPGVAGVIFMGSSVVGVTDTAGNMISGLTVNDIDPNNYWPAADKACVLMDDNVGTTGKPRRNVIVGATLNEGAKGNYCWLDRSTGSDNYGESITAVTGAGNLRRVLVTSAAGSARLAGSSTYQTNLV